MPTCKEVTRAISTDELSEAGFGRRLAVRLHLLKCRYCRRYAAQIRALGDAARGLFGQTTDSVGLEDLKARILSQAPKGEGTGNGVT
jgi:hypothetical protein